MPEVRADGPVVRERIDSGSGDAALQVAGDVLQVLGRLAVEVARQVEVEVVLLALRDADQARVLRDVTPRIEDIHERVDVPVAQAGLGAVLHEAAAGVDHEEAFAGQGVLLVEDHEAGGDAGAVQEVGRQADDALEVPLAHPRAADVGLGITAHQHAVRQDARALAGALERADEVQQGGIVALPGGRRAEGLEALEGVVQRIDAVTPALVGKGWIGDDVSGALIRSPSPTTTNSKFQ